jgi:hypothetical protein
MNALAFVAGTIGATPRAFSQSASNPFEIIRPQPTAIEIEYRNFLADLGFRDFSAEAARNLSENKNLNEIQRRVLSFNQERYEVVNASRDLGAFVMGQVARTQDAAEQQKILNRMIELTARTLTMKPLGVPDAFPAEIEKIRANELREKAKKEWIDRYLQDQFERTERELVSDIMVTLYGEGEVRKALQRNDIEFLKTANFVEAKVHDIVKIMYTDTDMAQTKFLGRALAAGMVRFARLNRNPRLEATLDAAALRKGAILKNFISNELTFVGKDEKLVKMKINNGDFLMEYSNSGRTAWGISSTVLPGGTISRIKAYFAALYGNLILAPFITDEVSLKGRLEKGQKPSLRERIGHYLLQLPIARRGYSHAGIAQVNHDAKTGISMTWARDMYPNADLGGVRFLGIEGFGHDGMYQRFGVAKYDSGKFLKWAQELAATRGWQENVWESYRIDTSDGGAKIAKDKARVPIKTRISAEDFKKLVDRPLNQAEQFMNEVSGRVITQMDRYMVGADVMGFAQGKNMETLSNCTQTMALAFLQATNIDPQAEHDRWAWPIKLAHAFGAAGGENILAPGERIIAPAGFAWQSKLVKSHVQVDFVNRTVAERYMTRFAPEEREINQRVTDLLRPVLKNSSANVKFDQYNQVVRDYIQWSRDADGRGASDRTKLAFVAEDFRRKNPEPVAVENIERLDVISKPRSQKTAEYEKILRQFLIDVGFKDYVADMKRNLEEGKAPGVLAEGQLRRNIKSYEVFNASRELAITIISGMGNRLGNENERTLIADLTGRMLALQPMNPPLQYPAHIMALAEGEREKAMENHLWDLRRDNMQEHTRKIVSDIVSVMYGKANIERILNGLERQTEEARRLQADIGRIHSLAAVIIESLYMDTQIGRTAFLGRALAALLVREAKVTNEERIYQALEREVREQGLRLENFVGDTMVHYDDVTGKYVPRKIGNFNFILTRTMGTDTAFISAGAVPGDLELAKKLGVVGKLTSAPFFVTPHDVKDGMNSWARVRDRVSQASLPLNDGYSHVGFTLLRKDPVTGISMVWVADSYPEPAADASSRMNTKTSTGGMRLLGYEHYNDFSHHGKVLIASHDSVKFFRHAIQEIRKNGYPKDGIAFPAIRPEFNAAGDLIVPKNPVAQNWNMEITEAEFREIHREIFSGEYVGKSAKDLKEIADRWYNRMSERAAEKLVHFAERGIYFQWITPLGQYFHGGMYCSLTGEIAFKMTTGITIQAKKDRYIDLLHYVVKLAESSPKVRAAIEAVVGKTQLKDFSAMAKLKPGIIAPSGLVAQPFVGNVTKYDHPNRKLNERERTIRSPYVERNREMTRQLEKLLPRTDARYNQFATKKVMEVYKMTLAEADLAYSLSANAQGGIKAKIHNLPEILNKSGSNAGKSVVNSPSGPKKSAPSKPINACSKVFSL